VTELAESDLSPGHGAPTEPGADRVERLLAELNAAQREAVSHGEGPLLVLAGAGSGKTRVLTHRIAYLLATGQARPGEILAITFTNKAAQEMRERVEALVGRATRAMWVMTFHSACARIMRVEAERLGYSRGFSIYDEVDSLRMVRRCMEELAIDPKRYPPRAIRAQISGAKNKLLDAASFAEAQGSVFEENVADVYALYERRMLEANAMDFDDLLVRTVNVLELFEPARDRWRRAFGQVLVDEYQDTNRAQYRLLQLLAEQHRNLFVVGDDCQCLVAGTPVTMADGTLKPIEEVRTGDEVRSSYGNGEFRPARVTALFKGKDAEGIAITTKGGRRLVSTVEHVHFAGFRLGTTPQMHLTYLMWKRGVGFRVGVTRVYTDQKRRPMIGIRTRCFQERADAVWVISSSETDAAARVEETRLSLEYGLPMLPFYRRKSRSGQSLVGDQDLIDEIYSSIDTESGGLQLLRDEGLSFEHPHHRANGSDRRRNLTLTLCAEHRRATPMHRITVHGQDAAGRRALEKIGLRVRPAKKDSDTWRFETVFKDFGEAAETADRVRSVLGVNTRIQGRFGPPQPGRVVGNSLPAIPAGSVRPGMTVFAEDGTYDVVECVERVPLDEPVYDINVEGTHNFIAGGIVTHNSIYSFRHADIRNILDFERDFEDAEVVMLEQNYRSTQTILSATNALIANNRENRPKRLWSDAGQGDPVEVVQLADEHEEARWVAGEVERLVSEEGVARDEIAVFYRTNAMSRVLEDTLVRFELPYQVIGGTKFYERAEIKDAVAYLSLLVNPSDAISFARVVNSPRRGIGNTSQGRLLAHANTTGRPIWEVTGRPDLVPGLGAAAIKAVSRFHATLEGVRERAATAPVAELLEALLRETGYLEALEAERTVEAEGRVENLQELIGVAGEFDANRELEGEAEVPPLEEFLQQISLYTEQDALREQESLVTLMTIHNAKGLEYETVFIIGCEEGVFPHMRSLEEGGEEEERRLCYVGMTRARRLLYLTYARERRIFGGRREPAIASRFLDELPEELLEQERSAPQAAAPWAAVGGAPGAPIQAGPALELATGDDIVHASFGDGVVTGIEPGGVIVVRFAGDERERKLMADYAPIRKR
jgi:ATP-dependent DNA helicase UvrD/PcrA